MALDQTPSDSLLPAAQIPAAQAFCTEFAFELNGETEEFVQKLLV